MTYVLRTVYLGTGFPPFLAFPFRISDLAAFRSVELSTPFSHLLKGVRERDLERIGLLKEIIAHEEPYVH